MTHTSTSHLRILIHVENDIWIAHCLDYDIASQGKGIDSALDSLENVMIGQMILDKENGHEPLARPGPAPQRYWDLYDKGTKLNKAVTFRLPDSPASIVDDVRLAA